MKRQHPLISTIVLNYNNGDLVFETLDSILCQNYPCIELIVSDDGSEEFKQDEISAYIDAHNRGNIKRTVVRRNESNLGTVKHLEAAREEATGRYILTIAADDCWADETVFTAFAKEFKELGPNAEWITSQLEMRDEKLQRVLGMFVTDDVIDMLKTGDMKALLDVELERCALPSVGSAFRRSFFDKIGNLSDQYFLIEDYSSHLRWLRMGGTVHYLDKVTAYHRSGGVSHGNARNTNDTYKSYIYDFITLFRAEVEPYKEKLSAEGYKKALAKYTRNMATYAGTFAKMTVYIRHLVMDTDGWNTLRSIMWQDCMNFDWVIGCRSEDADKIINYINDKRFRYGRRGLKQVILVADKDDLPPQKYLDTLRAAASPEDGYEIWLKSGSALQDYSVLSRYVIRSLHLDSDEPFDRDAFLKKSIVPCSPVRNAVSASKECKRHLIDSLRRGKLRQYLNDISSRESVKSTLMAAGLAAAIWLLSRPHTQTPILHIIGIIAASAAVLEALVACFGLLVRAAFILRARSRGGKEKK